MICIEKICTVCDDQTGWIKSELSYILPKIQPKDRIFKKQLDYLGAQVPLASN